jgi:hypothetical protein
MKIVITTFLVSGFLAISLHVGAQPKIFQYRVNLVDAKTGKSISPDTVRMEVDEEEKTPSREGDIVSVSLAEPFSQKLQIAARPEGGYIPRTVVITTEGITIKKIKTVSVEKRPAQFNLPYLLSGAQRFERGDVDGGLALFEAAALSGSHRPQLEEVNDYEILLRWNYARGLQQACLVLGYDTCREAAERLSIVATDFTSEVNARRYIARRVNYAMVEKAIADLSAKETKENYKKGLRAFREKQYDAAIEAWEGLLVRPELLGAVQLTNDKLENDISFAKTRKVEASARDEQ